MADLAVRPTAKFIVMRAIFCALVFLAVEVAWSTQWRGPREPEVRALVAPLVLIWPLPGAFSAVREDDDLRRPAAL